MAAYEIPNMRFSAEAGEAVKRRRFVKINTNAQGVQAGVGDAVVGTSMVDATEGEVLEIANGIVMVEAAAAITAGSKVQSNADGKAIPFDQGTVACIAMTKASSGALVSVLIR